MIKNKKGIVLNFLLGLIFTIVSLVTVAVIFKSCFRITGLGEQSFNQLVELIERVKIEGGAESMPLHMDRNTAVVGFTSGAEKVINRELLNQIEGFFNRPPNCETNKACICLCQSGLKTAGAAYYDEESREEGFRKLEYKCKKIKCKSFESIQFLNQIDEDDFGSYPSGVDPLIERNYYTLLNGFIHTRNGPEYLPGIPTRSTTVYVENYKNIISVCFKYPCISEEMKNERFPITIDEFSKAKFMFTDGWMIGIDTNSDGTLETFYYIEKVLKDSFGNYYYEYKFGIRPQSAPEQASFLETIQEKSKEEFESRFTKYAKEGKLVQIDYDNEKLDINNFKPETRMDKEGKVIMVGITGSQ